MSDTIAPPVIEIAVEVGYELVRTEPSDIGQHLTVLRAYASGCTSVLELGVREAVSTWAFLRGLMDSPAEIKTFTCCDLNDHPNIGLARRAAWNAGLQFRFVKGNDLEVSLPEADLIFIDTWHVYGHLKRELEKFKGLAKRWIIIHDTTVDADRGESVREGMDIEAQIQSSGYSRDEIERGVWPAVVEFLNANGDWKLEVRYLHCNGLTVLEKVE